MRRVLGDVSRNSSALPLLRVLCSAQAVPATLPMRNHQPLPFPAHDTSNFTSLCLRPSIFFSTTPFPDLSSLCLHLTLDTRNGETLTRCQ